MLAAWTPPEDLSFCMAFNGLKTEDEALTFLLGGYAERRSLACTSCRRAFEDGDVIYRKRDRRLFEGPQALASFCRSCVAEWHPSWLENASEPVPCPGGCGALYSHWYGERYYEGGKRSPGVAACSEECARKAYTASRRVEHSERACEVCGQSFTPKRSDRSTCSDRCRKAKSRTTSRLRVTSPTYVANRDAGGENGR